MDKRLLEILCCPVSKSPLKLLTGAQRKALNQAIENGEVCTVDGDAVTRTISEGLIGTDGKVIYRIEDGIPVMLADQGIGTTQLKEFPRA